MKIRLTKALPGILLICASAAHAVPISLSGFLDDAANPALVGSDLGAALFGNDFDIANNVALYSFSLTTTTTVSFDSIGFAAGGIDPYFTLFQGSGSSGTFLESNFIQAFSVGGDFSLAFLLPGNDYTIAIGTFANMSFAENNGTGTLADGFVELGQPGFLGNYYYELLLDIDATPVPVPEPTVLALVLSGLVIIGLFLQRRSSIRAFASTG